MVHARLLSRAQRTFARTLACHDLSLYAGIGPFFVAAGVRMMMSVYFGRRNVCACVCVWWWWLSIAFLLVFLLIYHTNTHAHACIQCFHNSRSSNGCGCKTIGRAWHFVWRVYIHFV